MNRTPQVETVEISDSELDNVSGGLVGGLVSTVVGTADSVVPLSSTLGTVSGIVEGTTGIDAAGTVSNVVSGL